MNKEIEDFDNSFELINKINHLSSITDRNRFDEVYKLTDSFMTIYKTEKNKLPYHINILDLLWANENAHSRIFTKLLKQKSNDKFEILQSFSCYLTTQNPNFNYKPTNPRITSEKDRIDVLILDHDFAIIIENKIHNAIDQNLQLGRYIDKVIKMGINKNKIYIIYLTRDSTKEPEDYSWMNIKGESYKELFTERYFSISFKQDILPWLTNSVLPNCKVKDVYLKSTIEQYIDYLEGMFNLRKNNYKMNSELQNHIKEVFELDSTPERNYTILTNKLSRIMKVEEQVKSMVDSAEKECWNNWLRQLKIDFPKLDIIDSANANKYPKVGVIVEYNGMKFSVLIEKETNIYYGISRHNASDEIYEEIKRISKPLLENFQESPWWYGWKHTTFVDAYSSLKDLIESVLVEMEK